MKTYKEIQALIKLGYSFKLKVNNRERYISRIRKLPNKPFLKISYYGDDVTFAGIRYFETNVKQ